MGHELPILETRRAVTLEAVKAADVASFARKHQDGIVHIATREARNVLQVRLDQAQRRRVVLLAARRVLRALEVELGVRQVVLFILHAGDVAALAVAVNPLRFQHIFPTARIPVDCEGAALADVASDPQLSAAEHFALRAVHEEVRFVPFQSGGQNVVSLFVVELQVDER